MAFVPTAVSYRKVTLLCSSTIGRLCVRGGMLVGRARASRTGHGSYVAKHQSLAQTYVKDVRRSRAIHGILSVADDGSRETESAVLVFGLAKSLSEAIVSPKVSRRGRQKGHGCRTSVVTRTVGIFRRQG